MSFLKKYIYKLRCPFLPTPRNASGSVLKTYLVFWLKQEYSQPVTDCCLVEGKLQSTGIVLHWYHLMDPPFSLKKILRPPPPPKKKFSLPCGIHDECSRSINSGDDWMRFQVRCLPGSTSRYLKLFECVGNFSSFYFIHNCYFLLFLLIFFWLNCLVTEKPF